MSPAIPTPDGPQSLRALRAMLRERSVLAAMEVFAGQLGEIFRFTLPGFRPVMMVGPEAARFVLVTARGDLRWRSEGDPVTQLLRHGLLVEDGDQHDWLRRTVNPSLHKQMLQSYVEAMWRLTDRVTDGWADGAMLDMLVEMRRVALLILTETLYRVDFHPDMDRLWGAILKTLAYISPGIWMVWGGLPRPGYRRALQQMDDYLFRMIRLRRQHIGPADDMLGLLVTAPGMDDDLVRDQLLTILIAGHDTSTALLAWALWLIGRHPEALHRMRAEVDTVLRDQPPTLEKLADLRYTDQVISEVLRMYPPIHLGSRVAAHDLEYGGYTIRADTRVMYSIYLTHRLPQYWPDPGRFDPQRFSPEHGHPIPYSYLPFGGGRRNCIGAAFAQVEAKAVLARLLQTFDLHFTGHHVHAHMGATLEPRPGVFMRVRRRS